MLPFYGFAGIKQKILHLSREDERRLNELTAFNKESIRPKTKCGCFNCGHIFHGGGISEWLKEPDGRETALCPRCNLDAVIYETCGLKVDMKLLSVLHRTWIGRTGHDKGAPLSPVPEYFGYYDYLSKGIIFMDTSKETPGLKLVGDIQLRRRGSFSESSIFCKSLSDGTDVEHPCKECECSQNYFSFRPTISDSSILYGSRLAIEHDKDNPEVLNFVDSKGRVTPFEPRCRVQAIFIQRLFDEYGSSFFGSINDNDSYELSLYVRHEGSWGTNDDEVLMQIYDSLPLRT